MEGRQLLQYIIDTSDVVLAKKQEATEYLAKLHSRPTRCAVELGDSAASQTLSTPEINPVVGADSTPAPTH